jgi:hypothetical protein
MALLATAKTELSEWEAKAMIEAEESERLHQEEVPTLEVYSILVSLVRIKPRIRGKV